MVANPLVGEAGGRHDLYDMEGGPGHVVEVMGGEVGELLEGGRFSVGIGGLDLAADLVDGLGDEGRLADELEAEAFDQVLQSALAKSLHDGRRRIIRRKNSPRHFLRTTKESLLLSLCAESILICKFTLYSYLLGLSEYEEEEERRLGY